MVMLNKWPIGSVLAHRTLRKLENPLLVVGHVSIMHMYTVQYLGQDQPNLVRQLIWAYHPLHTEYVLVGTCEITHGER